MAKYIPKSQVKTDQYTSGGEYQVVATKKEYIGFYWKYANARLFTGRTPSDEPSEELEPLTTQKLPFGNSDKNEIISQLALAGGDPDPANFPLFNEQGEFLIYENEITAYNNIGNSPLTQTAIKRFMPQPSINFPRETQYQIGEFRRYFLKKSNQLMYFETNADQFRAVASKDRRYVWELFTPISLSWKLVGDLNEVYTLNKRVVETYSRKLELYGFVEFFKDDFTKYYRP